MKQKTVQLVLTFHTTSAAMELEKRCREDGIPGRLFPVPRSLTSDCGIAWRCEPALRQTLQALIEENRIETGGIYEMEL